MREAVGRGPRTHDVLFFYAYGLVEQIGAYSCYFFQLMRCVDCHASYKNELNGFTGFLWANYLQFVTRELNGSAAMRPDLFTQPTGVADTSFPGTAISGEFVGMERVDHRQGWSG